MMSAPAQEWVTDVEVISAAECKAVRSELEVLRPHWIQRHPVSPFYTLGASNYFDISFNPLLPYYRMAARMNPILREHLGWLYDRVAERLSDHFGEPVAYRAGLALPGFHILLAHQSFESAQDLTHREWFRAKGKEDIVGNAIHCDTAHLVVDWETPDGLDLEHPISITLSICLPKAGAGLNYWDFGMERTEGIRDDELRAFLLANERQYHPYRIGFLAIHSGLRFHQMAAMHDLEPDDERITLQGHGVRRNGCWHLFW